MMRSLFCINLGGKDGIAQKGGCAYVSFDDKGVNTKDILAAYEGVVAFVKWVDDYSAFVICPGLFLGVSSTRCRV
jgi:hypothetical protein